jgi:hypothetical protein
VSIYRFGESAYDLEKLGIVSDFETEFAQTLRKIASTSCERQLRQ